ncbi:MAG: DNA translocase FtsK [Desulfobacterales bacterium]
MRKEIFGILLFFLVVFTLISLLSYSPGDPSIHNAGPGAKIHNLFGFFGAHAAGFLIGLFGLGAFWIPVIFLIASIQFFSNRASKTILTVAAGGFLLIITTGSLFAIEQNSYVLFGERFSSGGMIGIPFKTFLVKYSGNTGGTLILVLLWIIGFIITTGFSLIWFGKRCWTGGEAVTNQLKSLYIKRKERKAKAHKQSQMKARQVTRKAPKIKKKPVKTKTAPKPPAPKQEVFEFMRKDMGFQLPSVDFLDDPPLHSLSADDENLQMQSRLLEKKLADFGVMGSVVAVTPGPVITTFEYEPAAGVKINKIVALTDDLALALRAASIRIVAPIPGKAVVGIEVPNTDREIVRFKELVLADIFQKSKSKLTVCLGKDIVGNAVIAELEKMPHLLIAGATGSGKSVALNTMICSLLYKSTPDDVKLIIIDPKRIELSMYEGIPHLFTPVVIDVKKATNALFWAVREMERRYEIFSQMMARNIKQYNNKIKKAKTKASEPGAPQKLPYVVIVIDELADLMMAASRDVEVSLTRLAQMARAAGIHLILATQRPSVDVLTGVIKANFPTRLSFQVSSKTDSRTIIDTNGAENLLGNGDMLFLPPGTAKLQRIHGAYISETELTNIIDFLKKQENPEYDEAVIQTPATDASELDKEDYDEKYDEAVALIQKTGQASISMIQRHLRVGYNRAARIIETMEKEGLVGPSDGVKPREVFRGSIDLIP